MRHGNQDVADAVLFAIALGEEYTDYGIPQLDNMVYEAGPHLTSAQPTRQLVEQGLRKLGYLPRQIWRENVVYSKYWDRSKYELR